MDPFYCLMINGGTLTDQIRTTLLFISHEMISRKDRRFRLKKKTHDVDGEIKTDYKVGFLGAYTGIMFRANFDTDEDNIDVLFVVKPVENQEELQPVFN